MIREQAKYLQIWLIALALSLYIIQGVVFNLLFFWVISPLVVSWLWLKKVQVSRSEHAQGAFLGFMFGASSALLYSHINCLLGVKSFSFASSGLVYVTAPLQAYAIGGLCAVVGFVAFRIVDNFSYK